MLDLHLRVLKEKILEPVVEIVQKQNVTPNQITVVAFVMGILCSISAACGSIFFSVLFWTANRLLDGVDGTVARRTNQVSDFGGYLDIVLDFVVYGLIPIGIAFSQYSFSMVFTALLLECTYFVNAAGLFYLSAILEKNQHGAAATGEMTTVTMPTALIEGSETVVFYFLFLLFPQHCVTLFAIFGTGVACTIAQRLLWASSTLDQQTNHSSSNKSK